MEEKEKADEKEEEVELFEVKWGGSGRSKSLREKWSVKGIEPIRARDKSETTSGQSVRTDEESSVELGA